MKVLFVCLGNICRSPLAEGVLQNKIDSLGLNWKTDSCGTGSYHVGQSPDPRSIAVAKNHGIDISRQTARQFHTSDFEKFDRIYVMDSENYRDLLGLARDRDEMTKIDWLLNLSNPGKNASVPDPYYDDNGFEDVYQMIEKACSVLVQIKSNDGRND